MEPLSRSRLPPSLPAHRTAYDRDSCTRPRNACGSGNEVVGSLDDYRLVAHRAELLVAQAKFTAEQRYAEVVKEAMSAFRMAVILAEDTRAPELAARVEAIRKLLGRRNGSTGRRKKENEPKAE